ncbi:trans-aconitate 2-methyltransferase [Labrys sp. KB_33_2]|uniref:class I SAM-dependent methyltransferase n=1 Tax=unclassified Labrys (in: a-proteobacteria) TaxID=2688601 RepID=UPI003EBA5388
MNHDNARPDRLYEDPDIASFYDVENEWSADRACCASLAAACASVLDLGCGTGDLAAEVALQPECTVFGVDPATAMLDIARRRPGGDRVTWVQGDGRTVRLGRRFDLIVMTGHAFQVFLTPEDRIAALRTIAAHLEPEGRFIFDSRNPAVAEWREWTPEQSSRRIEHPRFGPVEAWNDVAHDPATDIVTYGTHYRILAEGRMLSSHSRIAFASRSELEQALDEAGLEVEAWYGDWERRPCTPTSPDFIPLGRLRRSS